MFVRLGFSVAAHLDPEVLLLDEVLAVGDVAFQQKCLKRIDELTQTGRTVLFVSHTPAAVAQLCHRAIVINDGTLVFDGAVEAALDAYVRSPQLDGGASAMEQETSERDGTGEIRVVDVRVRATDGGAIVPGRGIAFEIDLVARRPSPAGGVDVDLGIWSPTTGQPLTISTRYEADNPLGGWSSDGRATLVCEVDELPLRPARYSIAVGVERSGEILDACRHQADFTLHTTDFYGTGHLPLDNHPSLVLVRQEWRQVEPDAAAAASGARADAR